ncbi:2-amino-4-hydroxy-6-hydroxymethyldihydropteridine pyrophosphokinase [Geofilum rubicundum JCM 15548]|uniref:2-amino-4-hydroxy-6-hydroxymethyldihydropteridine pyrophosphokinase n=1 Tax=Geofilum rubicundum JCM 15548 TaxID=1236989 RepID=A0A0E9LXT4_9BACT|nr:2-amino-4-hydroxy-6-hydroxymethyldihydropteridine pyrophosphokinase [Geofilum rubicundum JCM 15548]
MKALILLGGNIGETKRLMQMARNEMDRLAGKVTRESAMYESAAWGFEADQNFLNQVLEMTTKLKPVDLLHLLQKIEKDLGRTRSPGSGYASRGIDIDILFLDDLVMETKELTVPHPRLHQRRFTLMPLNEQWPDWVHPTIGVTVKELLARCSDHGFVQRVD